jgi:ABC-type proline/glycine betaine transport system substrate-binding protein
MARIRRLYTPVVDHSDLRVSAGLLRKGFKVCHQTVISVVISTRMNESSMAAGDMLTRVANWFNQLSSHNQVRGKTTSAAITSRTK